MAGLYRADPNSADRIARLIGWCTVYRVPGNETEIGWTQDVAVSSFANKVRAYQIRPARFCAVHWRSVIGWRIADDGSLRVDRMLVRRSSQRSDGSVRCDPRRSSCR